MADQVFIKDLLLRAIIGINPEERVKRQDVIVNVELDADTRPAAASDDIADAVNYRDIAKRTIDLVETSAFFLVEKLAEEIAAICLSDPRVQRVRVTIEKPTAVRFARSVGVGIERRRGEEGSRADG